MRDPRSHRRYQEARARYLAALRGMPAQCPLCGQLVDITAPTTINGRNNPAAPTIEHHLPIRHIRATARDDAEALAMACDTSLWSVAHKGCNSHQGGQTQKVIARAPLTATQSRVW